MATYLIEFDILTGHSPGTGATLTSSVLSLSGWRSIGDPGGGRFINRTGGVIRAIYLKVNGSTNDFQVTSASGGKLFNTIWAKLTGTDTASEVYFMDANVPSFGAFWMRVPPNTQQEIGQCDSGQECPFMGQAYAQNPAAPTGTGWTKIRSPLPSTSRTWGDLIAATPSDYRQIDAYGETPDGSNILFLSQGEVLHYDDKQKAVSLVQPPKVGTSPLVNSIVFDAKADSFNLLHNGIVVRQVKVNPAGMTELGRVV
jgi:hypothetical protein